MNRETSRTARNSYSTQILRGKENATTSTNCKRNTTTTNSTKPTLTTRSTLPNSRMNTTSTATTKPKPGPVQELPSNDDWKQKMSQMESVVGMLSTQVLTLTEHFSSTKNSIEQAAKDMQNAANQPRVIQVQPQIVPQLQPQEPEYYYSSSSEEEAAPELPEEPEEVIVTEKIVYETEEVLVSEEEAPEPAIDLTIFTDEIARLTSALQEQQRTAARDTARRQSTMDMLNQRILMTQANIDVAQSTLQNLRLENTQSNASLIDLDFQRKKIESDIKFTTERLQEELRSNREQLVNQIRAATEEFNMESESRQGKIRKQKDESGERLRTNQGLDEILAGHLCTNAKLYAKVSEAEENRRRMCDSIQELKGNIRILCRIAPPECADAKNKALLEYEIPQDDPTEVTVNMDTGKQATNSNTKRDANGTTYRFDRAFPPSATQDDVFAEVFHLVEGCVRGNKSACIFSYGQSGSGKTHTLLGSAKEEGIMQMSARYLFDTIAQLSMPTQEKGKNSNASTVSFSVYFTVMCVLNEELYDLFNNNEIQIKYTRNGQLDISSSHAKITSLDEFNECVRLVASNGGQRSRQQTGEDFHAIYQLVVKRRLPSSEEQSALLSFVDLNRAERHKPGEDVSLVNLGTVVGALTNNSNKVPFKESKLTEVMRDCIGGSTKTTMIAHITPFQDDWKHSANTLQFITKVGSCEIEGKSPTAPNAKKPVK